MDSRSSQNFCTQCGSPMQPDVRFCAVCGTPAVAVSAALSMNREVSPVPESKQADKSRGRLWRGRKFIFGTWLVLALLVAVSGFMYGWMRVSEDPQHTIVLSPEQEEAIVGYGRPDAWMVADGPTSPGGGHARLEEWYHYDEGIVIEFVNGTATDAAEYTPFDELLPANSYDPFDFDSTLVRTDVEKMLGEQGTPINDVVSSFPGYRAYEYASVRLLVGYLDGRFYTAQTY